MLLNFKLDKSKSIAFICSPRIGDSLFSLVTVNNLTKNGYRVDVYGDVLNQLREFFSWASIFPSIPLDQQKKLEKYDTVLHMYDSELAKELKNWHPNSIVMSDSNIYREPISMADIQAKVCRKELFLDEVERCNNIQFPINLIERRFLKRVIIQPTSLQAFRSWPAKKFVLLAKLLLECGFEPVFVVQPTEYQTWVQITQGQLAVKSFNFLSDVAYYIFESSWFIGNDSGIGHLASNLGIPTLTLFVRPKLARQWRPTWGFGKIVLPPWWLITRPLREKFWGQCTSVSRVFSEFKRLVSEYDRQASHKN